ITVVIIVSITLGVLGLMLSTPQTNSGTTNVQGASNAVPSQVDGVQEATVNVRGGYTPSTITLEANKPARINMVTKNTYDCSASLVIPSLKINTNLPSTGTTPIEIAAQKPGTEITGSCSMGMYGFKIKFI
ncbi:MAG: cupredoxin domain-containing protein, partial [bacterium]